MSSVYNVYMVPKTHWPSKDDALGCLQDYFSQVITTGGGEAGCGFGSAKVQWWDVAGVPPVLPHELVIYFVQTRENSLLTKYMNAAPSIASAHGRTAWFNGEAGSEVYVKNLQGNSNYIAAIAFHEAMHNKIDKRKKSGDIHKSGGGGLASAVVSDPTDLTEKNRKLMAAALKDATYKPWTYPLTVG